MTTINTPLSLLLSYTVLVNCWSSQRVLLIAIGSCFQRKNFTQSLSTVICQQQTILIKTKCESGKFITKERVKLKQSEYWTNIHLMNMFHHLKSCICYNPNVTLAHILYDRRCYSDSALHVLMRGNWKWGFDDQMQPHSATSCDAWE